MTRDQGKPTTFRLLSPITVGAAGGMILALVLTPATASTHVEDSLCVGNVSPSAQEDSVRTHFVCAGRVIYGETLKAERGLGVWQWRGLLVAELGREWKRVDSRLRGNDALARVTSRFHETSR